MERLRAKHQPRLQGPPGRPGLFRRDPGLREQPDTGRVEKKPAQWVFGSFFWVSWGFLGFFYIFAQKREFLGFFQFPEYF